MVVISVSSLILPLTTRASRYHCCACAVVSSTATVSHQLGRAPFSPALEIVGQQARHHAVAMSPQRASLVISVGTFDPTAEGQSLPLPLLRGTVRW